MSESDNYAWWACVKGTASPEEQNVVAARLTTALEREAALRAELARVTAERDEAREALEFYADKENWTPHWDNQFKCFTPAATAIDEGSRARAVYEEKP